MISERMLTYLVKGITKSTLSLKPTAEVRFPDPEPGRRYMLYMHVPFCERLCPYCSFNRYPYRENIAKPYFESMRREMRMLADQGYDIESIYVGGGTPTINIDELCETLDQARDLWNIAEVGAETNPNHLEQPWLDKLKGRVQRMSVGVQSFDDELLKTMDRFEKYGSGQQAMERIAQAIPYFDSLNVDMIFNFPTQTEEMLFTDLERIVECGARQTTFSPLYVSHATTEKMRKELGSMDWKREFDLYRIVDGVLAGGEKPFFERETIWTFTRLAAGGAHDESVDIDEYQTSYIDYPSIGSGSITHLGGALYVNDFSISDYNRHIGEGRMSIMGKSMLNRRDLMRYSFLLNLYRLRLDKRAFEEEFEQKIDQALPLEMAFMRLNGAFETDDDSELTLTEKGRYLVLVLYRQFLSGMNNLREQARANLPGKERLLLFGEDSPWA